MNVSVMNQCMFVLMMLLAAIDSVWDTYIGPVQANANLVASCL